jgi:hypothetical protein
MLLRLRLYLQMRTSAAVAVAAALCIAGDAGAYQPACSLSSSATARGMHNSHATANQMGYYRTAFLFRSARFISVGQWLQQFKCTR